MDRHTPGREKNQNSIYLAITGPICLVHVLLFFFFLIYDVDAMMWLNVASITIYCYCLDYLRRGRNPLRALYLTYMEILAHSFLAAMCVGWDLGFAQYMIGLVPYGYYACMAMGTDRRRKYLLPTLLAAGSCLSYMACRYVSVHSFSSLYALPLSPDGKYTVWVFNTACIFVFLLWSVAAFILDINSALKNLESANEYLRQTAYTDPLTGLLNRRRMMDLFLEAGDGRCVIMCDIDHFKYVNDSHGHDFGDLVLKEASSIIRDVVGKQGHVCRWGGEEFVVLYEGMFGDACLAAEHIRAGMEGHAFTMYGKTAHCTMTLGVEEHHRDTDALETVKRADRKLYWGKENGRNRVVCMLPEMAGIGYME